MAELFLFIIVAAVAIALGLWLFSHAGAVVAVIVLVVVVGAAFAALGAMIDSIGTFFLRRQRQDSVVPNTPSDAVTVEPTSVLSALESGIRSIRKAAEQERRDISAISHSESDILIKVEARKKFVRDQKLDGIACWLLAETWHYPTWSKRPDAAKHLKLPAQDLSAVEDEATGTTTVSFTSQSVRFTMDFRTRSDGWTGYSRSGKWKLSADGEVVLTLGLYVPENAEYDRWRSYEVESFKPGDWVAVFVALHEQAQLNEHRERTIAATGPAKVSALKQAFDL